MSTVIKSASRGSGKTTKIRRELRQDGESVVIVPTEYHKKLYKECSNRALSVKDLQDKSFMYRQLYGKNVYIDEVFYFMKEYPDVFKHILRGLDSDASIIGVGTIE